jgi:hypothetical protein
MTIRLNYWLGAALLLALIGGARIGLPAIAHAHEGHDHDASPPASRATRRSRRARCAW